MTKLSRSVRNTRKRLYVGEEIASHDTDTVSIRCIGGRREVLLANALYRRVASHRIEGSSRVQILIGPARGKRVAGQAS
jgi:hypothetical protein